IWRTPAAVRGAHQHVHDCAILAPYPLWNHRCPASTAWGRVSQGSAAGGPGGPAQAPTPRSLRERFGALRNLPPFLKLIWDISPTLTIASGSLRLIRALLPVITLYVGKLIIDEVIALAGN